MNSVHVYEAPDLAAIDLNVIVAFDALARERSVTRAAHRLGVTQSAMSHALRRLRDLLRDPLLVRGRGGMVLTPRAEELAVPVRSGLVTLGRALAQPGRFEARSARRVFSLASPDLFDVLAVPPLLERVRRDAPGIDLVIVPLDERRLAERLETGDVDVAIVARIAGDPPEVTAPGLVQRMLLRDRFTCLIRADHPAITGRRGRRPLSLATYAALSHAMVSPSGEGTGLVDRLLAQRGLRRRVALRLPHFYSALPIVARSDLILTGPAALAQLIPSDLPIVAVPPPLPLPGHTINLIWHERFSRDPGHAWLRDLVAEVARAAQRAP